MALILDDKYPEIPGILARIADEILTGAGGLPPEKAGILAMQIAEAARHEFGGSNPYWPKGNNWKLSGRDRELWDRFNGHNYFQLSKETGLCEMRIRQIIERIRREERATRQGRMDGPGFDLPAP